MTLIQVPKPPRSAWDPNRPVSTLLKSQIEHLYEAEKRLPHRYRSEIYINAIRTEGEAAEYIQKVTAAIHRAHREAEAKRGRRGQKGGRVIAIAAMADDQRPARRAKVKRKSAKSETAKSKAAKAGRKKK